MSEVDLRTQLAGIELPNPVMLASGTCGYGTELEPFLELEALGGLVAKSLTLEPRVGNPPQRITETPAGMLNAIGVSTPTLERMVRIARDAGAVGAKLTGGGGGGSIVALCPDTAGTVAAALESYGFTTLGGDWLEK